MAHNDGWWPMATLDMAGRFIDVNVAFATILGRSPEELVGAEAVALLGRDAVGPELEAAERLDQGEGIVTYHRDVTLATGSVWHGQAQLSMVRDADGHPELLHLRLIEDGSRRPPDRIAWREGDFQLALDEMRVGVAIIGLDGTPLQANRALCELLGLTEEELLQTDLLTLTHPDDRDEDIAQGTRAWLGEFDSYAIEKRVLRPDGEVVWVRQEVTFARDEEGELVHLIGQVIDIGDRKQAELELARSRQELDDLVRAMPIGLVRADAQGRVVTANPAAAAIAGVGELARGFDVVTLVHPDDLSALSVQVRAFVAAGVDYHVEFRIVRPDGTVRWIRNDAHPEFDADGDLAGFSGTWLDVTELKAAEDHLRHHASHDSLTGLVNRRIAFDELTAAVARAADDPARRLSVLFVDLDGFKEVNDARGHGVGDQVLVEAAARLRAVAGEAGRVGRFGGDEFVVVVETAPDAGDGHDQVVEGLAEAIVDTVRRPFASLGPGLALGASVGVADWRPGQSVDALLSAADRQVYAAKRAGRGRWRRG